MEEEKDSRQFGSLLDSLARLSAGSRVEPRWAEVMKLVSSFLEIGEYGAMGSRRRPVGLGRVPGAAQRLHGPGGGRGPPRHPARLPPALLRHPVPGPGRLHRLPQVPLRAPLLRPRPELRPRPRPVRRPRPDVGQPPAGGRGGLHQPAHRGHVRGGGGQRRRGHPDDLPVDRVGRAAPHGQRLPDDRLGGRRPRQHEVPPDGHRQRLLDQPQVHHPLRRGGLRLLRQAQDASRGPRRGTSGSTRTGAASGSAACPASASRPRRPWPTPRRTPTGPTTTPTPRPGRCGRSSASASSCPTERDADWLENNYPGWYDEIGNIFEHWREDGYDDPANHMLGVDLFINGKIPVYICRVCQMPTIMPTFYDGLTQRPDPRVRRPQARPVLGVVRADVPEGARALHRPELLRALRRLGDEPDRRGLGHGPQRRQDAARPSPTSTASGCGRWRTCASAAIVIRDPLKHGQFVERI